MGGTLEQLQNIRANADALRGRCDAVFGAQADGDRPGHPYRGGSPRRQEIGEEQLQRAREMRAGGASWHSIAKELGKAPAALRRVLDPGWAEQQSQATMQIRERHERDYEAVLRRRKKTNELNENRRPGQRAQPYLGTPRWSYYAKEDSMGSVIDMAESARNLAERVDAAFADASADDRADRIKRALGMAGAGGTQTRPTDMVDASGARFRNGRAFINGVVVQRGGWYHPRGEPHLFFLCKRVEWMWDPALVSAGKNSIIAIGEVRMRQRKNFAGISYGKTESYKSPTMQYYDVSELMPGTPYKEDD